MPSDTGYGVYTGDMAPKSPPRKSFVEYLNAVKDDALKSSTNRGYGDDGL